MENLCNYEIDGLSKEKLQLKKGIIGKDLFKEICKTQKKNEELIRTYLLNFKLAVELDNGQLFIPSIVSDRKEVSSGLNISFS